MRKIGILLLVLGFCGTANAVVLKIATITPEGSQWMTDMRAGAKETKERTDGRVQFKYYGGGIQGNDTKVLGKMRIGSLQGGAFTPTSLQALYPDLNLLGLPMMFESEEEAAYVRGFLDEKLKVGLEEAGFVSGRIEYSERGKWSVVKREEEKGQKKEKGESKTGVGKGGLSVMSQKLILRR